MENNENHIDHLIARYISGEASANEISELKQWMDQSAENKKRFEQMQFVDKQAVVSETVLQVDVDKAWNTVHARMRNQQKKNTKKRNVRSLPVWIRIAAMLVLVFGIAVLLYKQSNLIQSNKLYVESADSVMQHVLSDSSLVTLNKNSKITYAANYGKNKRKILLQGEAFFDVKNMNNSPFIVETAGTIVKVTGTSFNIKGEPADSLVEVCVKTGSVLFFTENNRGVALFAGETGIYNKKRNVFTKIITVDNNVSAYATRTFVFYNTTLAEVIKQLRKVYNVNIELEKPLAAECTITVTFDNNDIDTILSIIAETLDLTLEYKNGAYTLCGYGCSQENIP